MRRLTPLISCQLIWAKLAEAVDNGTGGGRRSGYNLRPWHGVYQNANTQQDRPVYQNFFRKPPPLLNHQALRPVLLYLNILLPTGL
ncbi:hypothetical protein ACTXT7_002452 [Hymenolepis weldensis]